MSEAAGLPDVSRGREVALERSQKVSRALQDAARKARLTVRKSPIVQPAFSRANRASRRFALLSALFIFVLPTLGAAIYFTLIAADQFQVETKISVHNGEMLPTDAVGLLTGIGYITQAQEALVVMHYLESRAIVDQLQSQVDLKTMFSRPEADRISWLAPDEPIEELVKYWRNRLFVGVDPQSGILTVRVRAFRPEDTLAIARAVVADCEELVNNMSRRSRQDAVSKAGEELVRAERRLVSVREGFRQVRNQEGMIDPDKSADSIGRIISDLQTERLKAESELQVNGRTLQASAPQMQVLKARRDAVAGQIESLERTLTATTASGNPALSQSFSVFDKARLEQKWAEDYYKTVASLFEHTKLENERQQVYLETFVKPMLPEQAEYPRRLWTVFLVGICTAIAWFLITYTRSLLKL